jgi:hypothetical protein
VSRPQGFGLAALAGGLNEGGSVWTATAGVLANIGDHEWFAQGDARLGFATIQREVALELQWASLSAGLCRRWAERPTLFACIAPRLDVLRGVAPAVTRPTADLSLLPAVQFLVGARWPLAGRFALLLVAEAHLRVRGARFGVEPLGEIYSFPKQGFSLVAGPEARF